MFFHVYVLQSTRFPVHYVGMSRNAYKRLRQHNSNRNYSTRNKGPWKIIYLEKVLDSLDARKREKFLKSGAGRKWLKEISASACGG